MEYKITFKRELLNTTLHIIGGAVFAYILVPVYSVWIIVLSNIVLGGLREFLQLKRAKLQPWWITILDISGWVIGGLIWYFVRNYFVINADVL